jgi:hypothetical protein
LALHSMAAAGHSHMLRGALTIVIVYIDIAQRYIY